MRLFKIYSKWLVQANKQASKHMRNAVMLVWGSLRLAPTTCYLGNTTVEFEQDSCMPR